MGRGEKGSGGGGRILLDFASANSCGLRETTRQKATETDRRTLLNITCRFNPFYRFCPSDRREGGRRRRGGGGGRILLDFASANSCGLRETTRQKATETDRRTLLNITCRFNPFYRFCPSDRREGVGRGGRRGEEVEGEYF